MKKVFEKVSHLLGGKSSATNPTFGEKSLNIIRIDKSYIFKKIRPTPHLRIMLQDHKAAGKPSP
jgi:hypothetical protein